MSQLEQEIARLNEAVDAFAAVMKAKLAKKAAEGYRGWDKPVFKRAIVTALINDANAVEFYPAQAVDIANFAMMLWYQAPPILPERKPDAYLVVNDQGYLKGAWRDKAIADDIASRGQPSHHERVVPVRALEPLPEIPA